MPPARNRQRCLCACAPAWRVPRFVCRPPRASRAAHGKERPGLSHERNVRANTVAALLMPPKRLQSARTAVAAIAPAMSRIFRHHVRAQRSGNGITMPSVNRSHGRKQAWSVNVSRATATAWRCRGAVQHGEGGARVAYRVANGGSARHGAAQNAIFRAAKSCAVSAARAAREGRSVCCPRTCKELLLV